MAPLIHPVHLQYVLANPFREQNEAGAVLSSIGEMEFTDQAKIVGWLHFAILGRLVSERERVADEHEEAKIARQLNEVRNHCDEFESAGTPTYFLAFAMVSWLCCSLREMGDASTLEYNLTWLRGAHEHFAKSDLPRESIEHQQRFIEEAINNRAASFELGKDLYLAFCDHVVAKTFPSTGQ